MTDDTATEFILVRDLDARWGLGREGVKRRLRTWGGYTAVKAMMRVPITDVERIEQAIASPSNTPAVKSAFARWKTRKANAARTARPQPPAVSGDSWEPATEALIADLIRQADEHARLAEEQRARVTALRAALDAYRRPREDRE